MNNKEIWEKVLKKLIPAINKANFLTWFQHTTVLEVNGKEMKVGVPSIFARDWLTSKYNDKIIEAAQAILPEVKEVSYEVDSTLSTPNDNRSVDVSSLFEPKKKVRKVANKQEVNMGDGMRSKLLNPKYTLDNYISGQENRLIHAACSSVAQNPGGQYNPLFIYGGVGLGKTHLLQATGNEIMKNYPGKTIAYLTSERFMNEVVEAIQSRNTRKFKDRYRNVDGLIIDDIQFLATGERTQEEFFHTFNDLYDNNKQIIISSDRPPLELKGLADRLKSRFEMGMVLDVQFPQYETRLAILQSKCMEHQVIIVPEVLEFIASNVKHSIRELEGVLLQAMAQAQLDHCTPTVKSVASLIKKLNKDNKVEGVTETLDDGPTVTTSEDVLDIVSKYYKVSREALKGPERRKDIMVPRQICMYLIRTEMDFSLEKIGEDFGGRNHTTVMHACNNIIRRLKTDSRLVRDVNAIKKEMGM